MKYVMLKTKIGGVERLVPFIFPNEVVHSEIVRVLKPLFARHGWPEPEVRSAGEVAIDVRSCYGDSETLKVKSHSDDQEIIDLHDYLHGVIA